MSADPDEFAQAAPAQSRENLRARFPISSRLILRRSAWAILALLLCCYGLFQSVEPAETEYALNLYRVLFALILLVMSGAFIKILFEVWYFISYSYALELEHIIITRGVLYRSRYSIAIAKINDVTIKRDPVEMILQIYTLTVYSVPVEGVGESEIQGLSRRNAAALQTYVLALLRSTLPHIKKEEGNKAIPPPEDQRKAAETSGLEPPKNE